MDILKDLELLNQGVLPDSLNFNLKPKPEQIDVSKIQYNAFYKTFEYWSNKFPEGHQSIPGFDKIIHSLAENAITPLQYLNQLNNVEEEEVVTDKPLLFVESIDEFLKQ